MRRIFEDPTADHHLRDLLPDVFAAKAAHFISELNAIHPFREGNGRTQNAFLKILADQGGHPLDFERLDPPELLAATITAFMGDEEPLTTLIRALMRADNFFADPLPPDLNV